MKSIIFGSIFILILFIDTNLLGQESKESLLNKISHSNYSICYARINKIDSIPFLKVDSPATNLISEELVFAFDFEIDNTIEEIEEEKFIEYSFCNEVVNIKDIELSEMIIVPLSGISNEMGIEFYGVVSE
jgi:hypothetical protein